MAAPQIDVRILDPRIRDSLPAYATPGAAGMDLRACIDAPITVAPGDTVSTISLAYREKGIKVTVDQILKANPDLVPEKMPVGRKIWIPAPK